MALFLSGKWRWSEASNFWGTINFQTSSMQPHVDKIESGCNTGGCCKKQPRCQQQLYIAFWCRTLSLEQQSIIHLTPTPTTSRISRRVYPIQSQWNASDGFPCAEATGQPVAIHWAQTWKKVAADTVLHPIFAKFCKFLDEHSTSLSQPPSPPSTATSHSTRFLMHSLRRLEQVNSSQILTPPPRTPALVCWINQFVLIFGWFEFWISYYLFDGFKFQPPKKLS
jgi:hypothetical protein